MQFKKIVFALFVILMAQKSEAQKSVYIISYETNWGLTDSMGTEIVAPKYDDYNVSKDKNFYLFRPESSSEANVLLYNAQTGEMNKKYKYVHLDDVTINEEYYHYFDDDKKTFLQNSKTNEILKTKEKILDIKNIGNQYLVAKFYPTANDFPIPAQPKPKPKPVKPEPVKINPKTGKLMPPPPPKIIEADYVEAKDFWLNAFVFYKDTLPLKAILKIEAHAYIPLYEKETESNVLVQIVELSSFNNFDYLAFRNNKQLFLYDKNLKLVKKMPYTKTEEYDKIDEEYVSTAISKALGKDVKHYRSVPPSVGDGRSRAEEKKRDAFEVKKTSNEHYQLIRTSDEKVCFSTSYKMEYNENVFRVSIENNSEKPSRFYIDKETGKPFLPKKYMDLLQVTTSN